MANTTSGTTVFDKNFAIDEIIEEPLGGAHRDPETIANDIKHSIIKNLNFFQNLSKNENR